MPANDPTKQRVRDLQPTVSALVCLPIPSHEVSLTVPVLGYGAEECAAFQVTPPYLTRPSASLAWERGYKMHTCRTIYTLVQHGV